MEYIMKKFIENGVVSFKYVPTVEPVLPEELVLSSFICDFIKQMWATQYKAGRPIEKVTAIKLIREFTNGCGLKTAKDAMEILLDEYQNEVRGQNPAINVQMTPDEIASIKSLLASMSSSKRREVLECSHISYGSGDAYNAEDRICSVLQRI